MNRGLLILRAVTCADAYAGSLCRVCIAAFTSAVPALNLLCVAVPLSRLLLCSMKTIDCGLLSTGGAGCLHRSCRHRPYGR